MNLRKIMEVKLIDLVYNNRRVVILVLKYPEIRKSYVLFLFCKYTYYLDKLVTVNILLNRLNCLHYHPTVYKSIIPIGFSISVLVDNILSLLSKDGGKLDYKINLMKDFYIKDNSEFFSVYCNTTNYINLN